MWKRSQMPLVTSTRFQRAKQMALGSKAIKGLLSRAFHQHNLDLVALVLYETTATAKHFRSWLFERSKFCGKTNLKLNIGCGANVASGWIIIYLKGPAGVFRWDCRRGTTRRAMQTGYNTVPMKSGRAVRLLPHLQIRIRNLRAGCGFVQPDSFLIRMK